MILDLNLIYKKGLAQYDQTFFATKSTQLYINLKKIFLNAKLML
jgi:hypothetical protein